MKCPICIEHELLMTERQGIEVDYCPKCRGVWLDRGELDKLIERSAQSQPPAPAPEPGYARQQYRDDDDGPRRGYGRKKRGFLGDIFDFD